MTAGGGGSDQKSGGQPVVRVFLKGGGDVIRSLLGDGVDPPRGAQWVQRSVHQASGGGCRIEWAHEPAGPAAAVLEQLEATIGGRTPPSTQLVQWSPDVVVLSLLSDADADADDFLGPDFAARFQAIVGLLKNEIGAHVIVFNCSSVDPRDRIPHAVPVADGLSLRIHRLNLALVELSVLEGLSIVDVDRLAAEHGADDHVLAPLQYSDQLYRAIGAEFVRILADYGFFERRPLVPQLGTRAAAR